MPINRQFNSSGSRPLLRTVFTLLLTIVATAVFNAANSALAADDPPPASNGGFDDKPAPKTKATEQAVAAGLFWLARHQAPEGNWSLKEYTKQCKDKTCTGPGQQESLSAATAMGALPLLAAGQTQQTNGPFQKNVSSGVDWLIAHQTPTGDLSAGATQQMYSHGIAAIALCEDYGMTRDKAIGDAAQKAIDFIQASQNKKTGGWRYHPGEEGDTSVLGWEMTALKSGQLAGLKVKPATLDGAKKWLASIAKKDNDGVPTGEYPYQRDGKSTPTMSAVGLLCNQYLGASRTDPLIVGGVKYVMAHQPDNNERNVYYWFFATRAMHNMSDANWDTWNRKMHTILVDSQVHEGCATGSWAPDQPTRDGWGQVGGRMMTTSLSCLMLEVYYHGYLPLYKLDKPEEADGKK